MEKQIEVYQQEDGNRPYSKWITALTDRRAVRIIHARISRMKSGNSGYVKSIGEGVFEAKIDFGPGYRIYFAEYEQKIILLLIGGNKKTQKKDIEKAKAYKKDYEARL